MMNKEDLRARMLRQRRALSSTEKVRRDEAIVARLKELPEIQVANVIAGYWPLLGEVDIRSFLRKCQDQGKAIVLPVPPYREISVAKMRHFIDESRGFDSSPFDDVLERTPLAAIEVAIVPIVGFDSSCSRLGRGSGYYDRLIAAQPEITTIGVAYELQKATTVPIETHDQPLDIIITERSVLER